MKKFLLLSMLAIAIFATSLTSDVMAQVPKKMNYQASLLDASGKPLTGNPSITFKIYDAETGGTELWNEVQNVTPVYGFINVELGKNTPIELAFDQQYWLEVTIANGTPFPRTPLLTTPYSFRANTADSAKVAGMSYTANEAKVALDLSAALKNVTGGDVTGTYPVLNFDDSKLLEKLKNGKITQDMLNPNITFPPSGPAYGDLTGFYPGPAIAAGAVTNIKLANDAVTTEKILNGTILNEDIKDPNYTITSSDASILVPGDLVLGQDFNLALNLNHSNTWTTIQHFNGGLTMYGHNFDNPTTAGQVHVFDGTNWISTGANGDVTGLFNALRVEKLWNMPLNGPATTPNQLYIFDGTKWNPGLIMNANVAANAAIDVTKLAAGTANQFLVNDGTTNKWSLFNKSTNFVGNGVTSALELSTTGVTAGTYGSSFEAPIFSVDAFGRLSFAGKTIINATGASTSDLTVANGLINNLDLQIKVGSVGSPEILDGSIQNIDIADPNYTITSNGSITVPGALVLGQDYALSLNMANTNTWTAVQNFNGGLTGTNGTFTGNLSAVNGTFSGTVTAGQFNGPLQYSWTAGEALTAGSFNNSANKTFNVLYDNSTIGLNGTNKLYVKASGITANEIADNAVTEPKLNMFNSPADKFVIKWDAVNGMTWADASVYVNAPITGNGTAGSPLGLAYQASQLGLNGTNQLYIKTGAITSTEIADGTIVDADIANATITNAKLVNSSVTITGGNGLTNGGAVALGGTLNFDVNVDNSSLEINADALRVKDNGITEPKLNMFNSPADKFVIKWDAVNGMTWADASVYVQDPITGNGTQANPLGLAYDATLKLTTGNLGLDLAHTNTWTAVQNFNAGLTGTNGTFTGNISAVNGTFSGTVTAAQYNGNLQYGVTAGTALAGGTYNNSGNKTFDVQFDNSTIGLNSTVLNQLYVKPEGITANEIATGAVTTSEILDGTILNADISDPNYTVTSTGGSMIAPGALVLGQDFNLDFNLAHTNTWTAVQNFNAGLTGTNGTFTGNISAVNGTFSGNVGVTGTVTAAQFNGNLQYSWTAGEALTAGSFNNSANKTFNVLYDNSTIGLNGTNKLYVPTGGIKTNEILDGTILNEDIANLTIANGKLVNSKVTITGGNGLTNGGDVSLGGTINFDVNVDNSTIEINADALRVKAEGITANEIATGAVTTSEILDGTILNADMSDPNYTVTSTDASLLVPGALVLGQDFNLALNLAHTNTWTAVQNFNAGLTGTNGTFTGNISAVNGTFSGNVGVTGTVTAAQYNGNLQYGVTAGYGLLGGTFNNGADKTFTVDEATNFNWTGDQTWAGLSTFNNNVTIGASSANQLTVNAGSQFNYDVSIANSGIFVSQAMLNLFQNGDVYVDGQDLATSNAIDMYVGMGLFDNNLPGTSDLYVNGNLEVDGEAYLTLAGELYGGEGLNTFTYNGSTDVIANVLYDNSTIGLNGTNQLYVPEAGITTLQIANGTIINEDIANLTIANGKLVNSKVTITGGNGLTNGGDVSLGGTINFDVNVDNSTIEINADVLRVKAEGITNNEIKDGTVRTEEIADGTIKNIDIENSTITNAKLFDPDYTISSIGGSMIAPGALVLGQDFNLDFDLAHTNTWLATQTFNGGLTGTTGAFSGVVSTGATFNGNLQYSWIAGEALTSGSFNNSANKTFNVLYDNSTIGLNGSNQLYVKAEGITNVEIKDGTVRTNEIADGTILNIDMNDPNYTVTSTDASLLVPGALVLGQDFNLALNLAHTNHWTALQYFDNGVNASSAVVTGDAMFGTTSADIFSVNSTATFNAPVDFNANITGESATFAGIVTANQFNGNLQYGVTAGTGLTGGTFNNNANRTFSVVTDNSTIGINGTNQVYVIAEGITNVEIKDGTVRTQEILNGTILNEDMFDPNYTVTSTGGSIVAPGALVLGQDFNLDFDLAHTNTWTAVQNFDGGLTGTTGTFSGVVSTAATFNGNLQYTWTAGEALTAGSFNNSANKTFNVLYDNSTIGLNGTNKLYVPTGGITTNEILNGTILNEDMADPNYTVTSTGGSIVAPGALVLGEDFNLDLDLAHTNTWTAVQNFDGGLTATDATITGNATIGTDATNNLIVNANATFNGFGQFNGDLSVSNTGTFISQAILNLFQSEVNVAEGFDVITGFGGLATPHDLTASSDVYASGNVIADGKFVGQLNTTLTAGTALATASFDNTADATFNVQYDNSTIGVNGSNQLYVIAEGITNNEILDGTVRTNEILNGTILNEDMFDPNYTVTSTGGSIVVPGALVLGEDFNLDLDLAHTNTWTAVQNFDGGLTGTTGAFSGVVSTGATFNGNLQYTWTAGEALTSGSFNNSADKTFNVLYDNSTIGLNGSNQLYVKASGITATELANNAVTEPKLNMFNAPADKYVIKWDAVNGMTWADASVYVNDPITGNGTLASPLGLAYDASLILNGSDLSLNMANSNSWTVLQSFDGLEANTVDIFGATNIGLTNADLLTVNSTSTFKSDVTIGVNDLDLFTVNSTSTFNGSAYFLDGVTSNVFIGALDKTLSAGTALATASFNNTADVTFNVQYDNTTIGVAGVGNGSLFVKDNAITEPKLAMNNAPGAGYVIKWNNVGGYMEWADASVYVDAPITGLGTSASHLGLAYNSSLTLDGTNLGINLTHTNTWGIKQIFNTTIADAAVEVRSDIDGLAFSVSKGTASFTGGQVQVNVADNVVGSTNPLFVVQQSGTDGGGVLIQNSGVGAPALDIYQTNAAQPALNINQGSVVMSNNSYAADGALDLQFTVHAITGGTTYTAAAGINGQFIYVVNTTGGIITVNGTNVAAGSAATFVYSGAWYKVN